MHTLTKAQLLAVIRARVATVGSQKRLADALGCSQQYLSDVLAERRDPGPTLLRKLGYEAETIFTESA